MAAFTSKATGGWDTEGQTTWNEVGHPVTGDSVIVNAGHTVSLESATACASLRIEATGAVTCTGANWTLAVSGDLIISGSLNGTDSTSIGARSLTITATGLYTAASGTTFITGKNSSDVAWSNANTFTHHNGKVDFQGQTGTYKILGNNTWYQIEISISATCIYLFETAKTQTVADDIHLVGAADAALWINSTTMAAAWLLNIPIGAGGHYVAHVGVMWSDASAGGTVTPEDSQDCGYNTNWTGWAIHFGNTNRGAGAAGAAAAAAAASAPGISGAEAEYQAYINKEMQTRPILTAQGPIGQVTRTSAPPQPEILCPRDAEWKAYIDEKMKTQPILTASGPIYPQQKRVIGRVIRKRRR